MEEMEHIVYCCQDLEAVNTANEPDKVDPCKKAPGSFENGIYRTELEKCSWHMIRFQRKK